MNKEIGYWTYDLENEEWRLSAEARSMLRQEAESLTSIDFLALFELKSAARLAACIEKAAQGQWFEITVEFANTKLRRRATISGSLCTRNLLVGSFYVFENTKLFFAALDAVQDGVIACDNGGEIILANKSACNLLGRELDALRDVNSVASSQLTQPESPSV